MMHSETQAYENPVLADQPKKEIKIPFSLRFALTWTLFFAVIGIAIQSIKIRAFVFLDFFASNYANWFVSFKDFANSSLYSDTPSLILAILDEWYYFFYTVGLLTLIWGLIDLILGFRIILHKSEKKPEKKKEVYHEKIQVPEKNKVESLLDIGNLMLAKKDIKGAKKVYMQMKNAYHSMNKEDYVLYKKILEFYDWIVEREKK